jgi:hypothetical protein
MSIAADLWIRIELLYLMIEPIYFQCFLRWLNDDVLDTGLVASVLNTGLICNSSDDDGE